MNGDAVELWRDNNEHNISWKGKCIVRPVVAEQNVSRSSSRMIWYLVGMVGSARKAQFPVMAHRNTRDSLNAIKKL